MHEQMFAHARKVAAAAPEGSPLHVLPLQAHFGYSLLEEDRGPESPWLDGWWRTPQVQAEIDAALHRWALSPARRPHALERHDRSVLTMALAAAGRDAEAGAQFAASDHTVFEYPWYYQDPGYLRAAHRRALKAR